MSKQFRFPRAVTSAATLLVIASALFAAGPARADCQADFIAIREEMQTKGKALEAAGKAKASPQELCPLFRAYTAAEGKMTKYLIENKDWCQIPEEAITQAKATNQKTFALRDKVCAAAAAGAAGGGARPPPQGSVSSALGVTTGYAPGQSSSGGGIFDTLTGNALRN
ncbi:hypothetical protein [Aquabacter spiritensis]|uniref:Uncharacterized protein n=1 Tax=Aquabacter spiritensis TaxID=933073 RepID=A0A4R3LTM4_9HYPH|nr:hypothetical protein [Aquabacter spiritensis]TCT02919.1 hypothetical protein EDC64_11191 [Aquabacter spiritensis]